MTTDTLTATLSALADPTRRAMLERLARGPASVKELGAPFSMSGPAISKHLRVLEDAHLIRTERAAQFRPRVLDPAPLKEIAEWVEEHRLRWQDHHDALADYLATLTGEGATSTDHTTGGPT